MNLLFIHISQNMCMDSLTDSHTHSLSNIHDPHTYAFIQHFPQWTELAILQKHLHQLYTGHLLWYNTVELEMDTTHCQTYVQNPLYTHQNHSHWKQNNRLFNNLLHDPMTFQKIFHIQDSFPLSYHNLSQYGFFFFNYGFIQWKKANKKINKSINK